MKIINGKKIAEKIKDDLALSVFEALKNKDRHPGLAIILVGDREDSKLYVSLKERSAKEVGVDTSLYLIDKNESEESVIKTIEFLNEDKSVDGILVQLPLPSNFDTDKIIKTIKPEKDVDGFSKGDKKLFFSPVVLALQYSLENCKIKTEGKKAFLFFNSEIFKNEIEEFFLSQKMEFDSIGSVEMDRLINENNPDKLDGFYSKVKGSDILVSAMGRPEFIDKKFLSNNMILLDIGISKKDGKVLGDIKQEDTKELEGYFTPVPGGIGPMTVACLLKNVVLSFLNKK